MKVILTNHVKCKLLERNIDVSTAKRVAKNGKKTSGGMEGIIIKKEILEGDRVLKVLIKEMFGGKVKKIIIITAYYED